MKAVIPVAGLGTRMLPATKAIPKEMLPLVDKPLIQYIVTEAVLAGIKDIVLVTHSSKNSIENHFDTSFELEATLEKRVKRGLLEEICSIIPSDISLMHIRQGEAKGLGHAILCARPCIGAEPFAVLLPDVIINQYLSNLKQDNLAAMIARFHETQINQVMVEPIPREMLAHYGVIDSKGKHLKPGETTEIFNLIEKPTPESAPSNLSIVGRYVFSPAIWPLLEQIEPGVGEEIQLTDAIVKLINYEPVEAYHIVGKSHDCGNKVGYVLTNIEFALHHPEVSSAVRHAIRAKAMQLDREKV
ncbi:UTP--glucose-1-phosphate uridylyltransferase GalU [Legionella longbeachae]|uniref:UTP--glucose-1-phosphate uridylyltransferase GalU n=1 Tax=Legionella longbeachae TaxID=450 RepID=UPI000A1BFF4D|nr:UTP--glucose-1-phosphate uridylyltransferase GalU [Legionella longbeachae]ARM33835.1 UTP--glucose-1-phosphate uridylyltransferase GalU [Legionella longbeachae]